MQAGFYTADITPPLGMEMPGGYGKSYSKQVHDPLKVRAAVFGDAGAALAFFGVDTCELSLNGRFHQAVRAEVERRVGIPAGHVLLGASHTHSGGPLDGPDPADYADAPELVQTLVRDHSTNPDPLYREWVQRQVVTAVGEAYRRRQEARLSVGSGREERSSFNRRFRMANGRVYTHPGKGNPDVVAPAGPIDPEVGVLGAWSTSGRLLGCLVNFGCHCTTFSGGVSADYVCYLERTIQGALEPDAVVVFLQGASGDVTQVDNQSLRAREFGEAWSRRVGTRVGAEAVKVLATAEQGDLAPLAAASRTLTIPRRRPSTARLEQSCQLVEEGLHGGKRDTAWTFAKELVVLDYFLSREPEASVEVQALQVGPAVFLANPAEYFAESGLRIKAASPFPHTFVVTLANGCVGYVPPERAFAPDGGGYETVLTTYSNLAITAEEQIADASLALARELTPGALPRHAEVDAPQPAWGYGVLGPDLE